MTTFDDRANAFENKHAHDSHREFRIEARRNKLVGRWAAGLLGKQDDEAEEYATSVVHADFEEAGIEDVVRKLTADLGSLSSDAAIRAKMSELLLTARAQIESEV